MSKRSLATARIILGLGFISISAVSHAELSFSLDEIELDKDVEVRVLAMPFRDGAAQLILIEAVKDEDLRFLSSYSFANGWHQDYKIQLEPEMQLLDIARLGSGQFLVGYRNPDLLFLNPETIAFEPLLTINSFFRGKVEDELYNVELVRDLNGDELDDVIIPNFDGWQISLQQSDTSFTQPQTIGPPPVMSIGSGRNVYYSALEPFLMDHNADGYEDLAFWVDGEFLIYHRRDDGQYETEPTAYDPGIDDIVDFLKLGVGTQSEDNSETGQKVVFAIEDLNGDALDDLLLGTIIVDGLFGSKTRIDVHPGRIGTADTLEFAKTPSSVVMSKGIQFDAQRLDIDDNGTSEMMVTSVNISIGAVIRVLFARTFSLDMGIYQMSNNQYPAEPNITRKITGTVDFSSGDVFIPAILVADVSGDGLKDLLVQDGPDELDVFLGNKTNELFAKRPIEIAVNLPMLRDDIQVVDLDGDGRDDLVMLFEAENEPTRVVTLRFHD